MLILSVWKEKNVNRVYVTNNAVPWKYELFGTDNSNSNLDERATKFCISKCSWLLTASFLLPATHPLYCKGQWLPAHCILKAFSQQVVLEARTAAPHSSSALNSAAVDSWLGNGSSLLEHCFLVLVLKGWMTDLLPKILQKIMGEVHESYMQRCLGVEIFCILYLCEHQMKQLFEYSSTDNLT